jgi:hypothetical protein
MKKSKENYNLDGKAVKKLKRIPKTQRIQNRKFTRKLFKKQFPI